MHVCMLLCAALTHSVSCFHFKSAILPLSVKVSPSTSSFASLHATSPSRPISAVGLQTKTTSSPISAVGRLQTKTTSVRSVCMGGSPDSGLARGRGTVLTIPRSARPGHVKLPTRNGAVLVPRHAQIVQGGRTNDLNVATEVVGVLYKALDKLLRRVLRAMSRVDIQLIFYFLLWYLGNYYHNITGKKAFVLSGGATGMPVTIATMQMGIGCVYALFLWAAPDARKFPNINASDVVKMIPVSVCNAGVHGFSSFATSAGAISFGQMIKAAEPVFAAVLGTSVYGQSVSTARWLTLIPIIGGVCIASVSELDFAWLAFWAASIANVFAAFKGNENAKLMASSEIRDKLETVGNQFAVTTLLSFLVLLPVMILKEGSKWGEFVTAMKTNPIFFTNFAMSGLLLYGYNECATMTIKKTSAMTQSVANTAKRAVVIIGSAIVFGESLGVVKLLGCAVALSGVLLYSVIDTLLHRAMRAKKDRSATLELLDKQPKDCLEAIKCMAECVGAVCEKCCEKCKEAMCTI